MTTLLLLLLFYFIQLTSSLSLHFSNPLQRFVYDDLTDTIIIASVNHIYSLNASDLSILSHVDLSPTSLDHQCLLTNKTLSSKHLYYFSTSSYLSSSINHTFNQLLLLTNNSLLTCSTTNRGGSCQLRSLIHLNVIKNSSQRLVSSSPFYPSIGMINKKNQILYLSNTYDAQCDPFYEIPTISGRNLSNKEFLSIINFNSGQSALQQSTYTLRLLNIRLIKDFFLHYLYAFEYKQFSYFLTIQQAEIHHRHKLQTKILRFCQTLKQPMIKSYVEIPLTCGQNYHYLITAKFSIGEKILYGLFRNTTLANLTSTSHAVCAYSIDTIQEGFFQTIKRCLVDGKGHRGLGFISPNTHCVSSKNINEINQDYCPDENESFFQYPIGGHRSIEQNQPIVQLNDRVNFTSIEIGSSDSETMVFLGDDNGTVHTFHTSNKNEIYKEHFQSKTIVDLQLIHQRPTLKNAKLIIMTDNQIIKQNLSTCEQYTTCNACSNIALCHWCSTENRCAASFECIEEKRRNSELDLCTSIERVAPAKTSLDVLHTELEVIFNRPLRNIVNGYMCRFSLNDRNEFYFTKAVLNDDTIRCLPPSLSNTHQAVYNVLLSIYHVNTNLTFGYYPLLFINCSNFLSCSSCTSHSSLCLWNRETVQCISEQRGKSQLLNHSHSIRTTHQCPHLYLQQPLTRLAYHVDKLFIIHLEQCNQSIDIQSCQLHDHRKRFSLIDSNPILIRSATERNLCFVKCSFQWTNYKDSDQISFHRPLKLNLSIDFSNHTTSVIPYTHISLYNCERLAVNCTSCLQLDPSFGCIWCKNKCMLRNQSEECANNRECLLPMIQTIEPLILPMHGGTLVTIKGKHFDLFELSIDIADVACQLIEDESSHDKIVCKSGDARSTSRAGVVHLKFGPHGPRIYSRQIVSYMNPKINSIKPLIGIQSGGTVLTIQGENFTIGNSHIKVLIGDQPCQLLSISQRQIQCETKSFARSLANKNQQIELVFDQQTKLIHEQLFTIVPNPILYSFDRDHQYKSFKSGGHRLMILGENFNTIQNIQLEFKHQIFVSPVFHNQTHLTFLTPSTEELNLNTQQTIDITIYLDNFNQTASLVYINDPFIYELEPLLQTYTTRLTIHGTNLTVIGHTKDEILVHIGCELCTVVHLQADRLICQPPRLRPEKYSKAKRLCYNSEHPSIIVSIDNIQIHVGFMVYPKKLIVLGVISGCLLTILFIVLIIVLVVCFKIRYTQRKYRQGYSYTNSIIPHDIEKEKPYQLINTLSTTLRLRPYVNYLQMCYYSNHLSSDDIKYHIKSEIIDQFKYFIENHEQLVDYLFKLAIQSNNKKIVNNLILTQRYNFRRLFQFNYDTIYFNICILTSYEAVVINPIREIFSRLYHQLQFKLHSGPIDAIEQTMSYYSLNIKTILHDSSITFKTIQLIVHIDRNNSNGSTDLLINLTCLTCDTISQVKERIFYQLNSWKDLSLNECQLYLLTNHSSSSSSSSTASSSVPLVRKSMLTQVLFNRTIKYSTTTINDPYRESNILLLNDIDHTNEHIHSWKKLNTLQHYGIITDGYELKMVLVNKQINYPHDSLGMKGSLRSSCHYCSLSTSDDKIPFNYLTPSAFVDLNVFSSHEHDRTRYIHLLNHTYEEIDNESGHLLLDNNHNETYRLFETKSIIHTILMNLIETLFTNLVHSDTYLSELIEQYKEFYHIFYAHFIPFLFQNFHCLFDLPRDKCLNSSIDILAMIFQCACYQQKCSICIELVNNQQFMANTQHSTLLFADEIQHIRLYYSNLERTLANKNLSSEYSSTNTGIDTKFELDDSIFQNLIDFTYLHADEIIRYFQNQSSDHDVLPLFIDLMQMYQSNERTSSFTH